MNDAEADRAAWTVLDDGSRSSKVGGARAVGLALAIGRDAAWPTLAWKVPGVPWVLDRAYDLIATNRHRLPGQIPWCEANPDECTPSAP